MRIDNRLQVYDSLLEHGASVFQGLDLWVMFEVYIVICVFSKQRMSSEKCWTRPPVNICGSTSWPLPSWEDLSDISSADEGLAPHKPAFWAYFPLALRITTAAFGLWVLERLPWVPPEEACRRFFVLLCKPRDVPPVCATLSPRAWDIAAELTWEELPSSPELSWGADAMHS